MVFCLFCSFGTRWKGSMPGSFLGSAHPLTFDIFWTKLLLLSALLRGLHIGVPSVACACRELL